MTQRNALPYKVHCKSSYLFFELIAAFDCEGVAVGYASQCATANPNYTYRVTKNNKLVAQCDGLGVA